MAIMSNKIALAIVEQVTEGTFTAPNATNDQIAISNLRATTNGVTIANNEYTGSIFRNGDEVAGVNEEITFNVNLRGPGGADVPAAGAFILGRILKAGKFTELRTTAAVPAAAEALVAATTSGGTLGAGAAATANLYKGLAIILTAIGATVPRRLSALRSYAADKTALWVEALGAAPTGTYQIPKQLSYVRSVDASDPPFLSAYLWRGGKKFSLKDIRISGLRLVVPVSTKEQAAYPQLEVTAMVTTEAYVDEASPAVASQGVTPKWKDGKFHVANVAVGGTDLNVDLGLRAAYPPNPNQVSGSDAGQLVEAVASVSMTRQEQLKAVLDTRALADAQTQHPVFAQWGFTSGNLIQLVIPDARFNYQNGDDGGEFAMESGDMMIDVFDRQICINFPYF
jgi:hypothetical protein